jgi:hypothetical protein
MTTTPSTRIGKTIVAACVGSIVAQLRQDDRVVAVDADTAFGTLGARVDLHATGWYWDLAGSPTSTSTPSPVIVNPSSLRYRAITSRGGMSVSDGVLGTRWSGTGLGRGRL